MKFWDSVVNMDTYDVYMELRNNNDWASLAQMIPELLREYPDMVKYVINRIDSCFGEHTVYVVDTNKGIKIGYTKNSIQERFAEKRYTNHNEFKINSILREETFQARGAVEFENKLKARLQNYQIQTDMVMPGKGELYDRVHLDKILSEYDSNKEQYKSVVGCKSPN